MWTCIPHSHATPRASKMYFLSLNNSTPLKERPRTFLLGRKWKIIFYIKEVFIWKWNKMMKLPWTRFTLAHTHFSASDWRLKAWTKKILTPDTINENLCWGSYMSCDLMVLSLNCKTCWALCFDAYYCPDSKTQIPPKQFQLHQKIVHYFEET